MPGPSPLTYTVRRGRSGQTILYLHGFIGGKEDWTEIAERVGAQYTHLPVDLPGHGTTAPMMAPQLTDHDFTMTGCASLVVRLLDDLHVERCHLVGYSMGGRLALYLLVHHGDRFHKAVVESASPGLETENERRARLDHDFHLARRLEDEPIDTFLKDWYAQQLFATMDRQGARFAALLARRRRAQPGGLARSLRLMGTGAQPSLWEDLGRIEAPLLLVTGERDTKFTAIAERTAPLCPKAVTAIIPHAGHNVHFERPDVYAHTLEEFLATG